MAKARAAKKPPEYKNIHPEIKALDDDNYLSIKNVKEWERHNKDRVKELKYTIRRIEKGKEQNLLIRELYNREGYLKNIATYFETGTWLDLFYGKDQEQLVRWKITAYAYDEEGYAKIKLPLDIDEDF